MACVMQLTRLLAHARDSHAILPRRATLPSKNTHADKSIALVNILESYDIYEDDHAGGNHTRPSKDTLKQAFGTSVVEECIMRILTAGRVDHHVPRTRSEAHGQRMRGAKSSTASGSLGASR